MSLVCSAPGCTHEPVDGQRYCRTCRAEKQREYYQRRKDRIAKLEYERRAALNLAPRLGRA